MRVLALDTATEACSVALLRGEESICRFAEGGLPHAQQILGMVEAVLAEAQVSLSMLDGIAASIGPGAFTGVRISVAVAQGLAFGADLRVVPVTTLEALAFRAVRSGAGHAVACLDARMGEVYWGCFRRGPEARFGRTAPRLASGRPRMWCSPWQVRFSGGLVAALRHIQCSPRCRVWNWSLTTARHCRMRANSQRLGALRLRPWGGARSRRPKSLVFAR